MHSEGHACAFFRSVISYLFPDISGQWSHRTRDGEGSLGCCVSNHVWRRSQRWISSLRDGILGAGKHIGDHSHGGRHVRVRGGVWWPARTSNVLTDLEVSNIGTFIGVLSSEVEFRFPDGDSLACVRVWGGA